MLLITVPCGNGCSREPAAPPPAPARPAMAPVAKETDSVQSIGDAATASDPVNRETQVAEDPAERCVVTIQLADDFSDEVLPGLVRVTNLDSGRVITLQEGVGRGAGWTSLDAGATVRLPRTRVRIEAFRGLETVRAVSEQDLTAEDTATARLALRQFYDSRFRSWYAGTTRSCPAGESRESAASSLRLVSGSEGLDIAFITRGPRLAEGDQRASDARQAAESSEDDPQQRSADGTLFAVAEPVGRHGDDGDTGFGRAWLLNPQRVLAADALGPTRAAEGREDEPLSAAIRRGREAGATVVACQHGHEAIPNWLAGLIDAQNLFDGPAPGGYQAAFYRYLDLGLRVPLSTAVASDHDDFARVLVPVYDDLTVAGWLQGLREGKSYITNGPLLELETERASIGDTQMMSGPNRVTVVGRGVGRLDFKALELVHNGRVVHRVASEPEQGYFQADLRYGLEIDGPGWFALRIPSDAGRNELGRPLFAHTSPIYIDFGGEPYFRTDVARQVIAELQASLKAIDGQLSKGEENDRRRIREMCEAAIRTLQGRVDSAASTSGDSQSELPGGFNGPVP